MFIMLNPSTADALVDDPTVRRCIGFARSWGYGGLYVGNLFAYRTSQPMELKQARDPVGPRCDRWLKLMMRKSKRVVAAWGVHGEYRDRASDVAYMLDEYYVLGLTRDGHPRHPLYLPANTELRRMQGG
jgi:hypothetical protein